MNWIAPSEKDAAAAALEKRFWDAADQFRANSSLECEMQSPKLESRPVRPSQFDIRPSRRLCIQLFPSALNEKSRTRFVMLHSVRKKHSSSMQITEEVRKYAAEQGIARKSR